MYVLVVGFTTFGSPAAMRKIHSSNVDLKLQNSRDSSFHYIASLENYNYGSRRK